MLPKCPIYRLGLLALFVLPSTTNSLVFQPFLSRYDFLTDVLETANIASVSQLTFQDSTSLPPPSTGKNSISFPLRFLPNGGCWALRVTLSSSYKNEQSFTYYGIVDTGSPFLTVPSQASSILQSSRYDRTYEQYGEILGGMEWRRAPTTTLYSQQKGPVEKKDVVLGVASEEVVRETGGVFVGLVDPDDARPTALRQLLGRRYRSFRIDFDADLLTFSRTGVLPAVDDAPPLPLVDLRPFGPDLYHYAVGCDRLAVRFDPSPPSRSDPPRSCGGSGRSTAASGTLSVETSSLDRPVLVVLDTGLTGCVFSDSLTEELSSRYPCYDWSTERAGAAETEGLPSTLLSAVRAVDVRLEGVDGGSGGVELSSREKYFYLNSIRLPWFYDEDRHPHIVAVGTTFWTNAKSLTVDLDSREARIKL